MAIEGMHTFCWFELATTNTSEALRFYQALFGWTSSPVPMGGDMGDYIMLQQGEATVGAMFTLTPATGLGHIPPSWNAYVLVQDVDASARRAQELGATIMKPAFDVMEMGRMAVLQDPTGAVINLWQAKGAGAQASIDHRAPGRVCWCEQQSRDVEAASQFYAKLFGWRLDRKGDDYIQIFADAAPLGGFFDLTTQPQLAHVPACWVLYFASDDVDASAHRVKELGGQIHMPPMDMEGVGRMAVVADPQGAAFVLFRLSDEH
jgi:predicted enzyme related to lactoylglutathione lyase